MSPETSRHKSITVESNSSTVGRVCERLMAEVATSGFDAEAVFAIHLALEEGFLNAVKHGNKLDSSKRVNVKYLIGPEQFDIFITDEGEGFQPDIVADPRCEENLYKPCGRGMLLMRSFMDVVEYNKAGNCVHMVKYKIKAETKAEDVDN